MKHTRRILSILLIILTNVMAAGTVVEKFHGNEYAINHIYGSWWFVALWGLTAVGIIVMLIQQKLWKRPVICMLHGSILLILLGALLTMLTGQHGKMTLQPGKATKEYIIEKHGKSHKENLPFYLILNRFEIETYPGTRSPMDFVSYITLFNRGNTREVKISMNHILKFRHYRFYQSDYNEEGNSVLSVSHDPWGVGVTYTGYILFLIAMVGVFFDRKSEFRQLLQKMSKSKTLLILLMLSTFLPTQAAEKPRTLPKESADKMGQMYVMYKGRVCPLQTLAKDFTTKLYGKARYQGYTPEQVLSGWLFYTDEWLNEPIPRLQKDLKRKKYRAANEKQQIINMLQNGQLLKIHPHADSAHEITWYSQNDSLPADIPDDEALFIRKQLSLCNKYVTLGDFEALDDLFDKTKIYQEKYALGLTQPTSQYRAERLYNRLTMGRGIPMVNIMLGLISFAIALICIGKGRKLPKPIRLSSIVWISLLGAFLAMLFVLRWIVGGHVPMAGNFDSMNLLALSLCIITLIISKKHEMALPAGLLMTGVVLLVQMIGGSNPPVTYLMPVLSSPLLSLHVTVIMIAYALLFFIMLNGICAVVVRFTQPDNIIYLQRLQDISTIMLYPAVALLAAGIVIGAVWANLSWGNYWSWDPKEVWALITLLIYALPLHNTIWTTFRKPMFFHFYTILAFLSVLITYFGVNLLLGGMHSYA